ncbi:penicillin-binding protein [Paenibacillus chitinolyticus]|uniref:serine hydrolase domain-containing protein n=1 Tax=Paenibacillus chitinolyticus TaxID=79263 RepID=UPI0026E4F790|nr:serine hydrolase domain-containing protein [Paenibacillus chitinolyticus]GKS09591.1 penicillin-binding protein [Paenibacillus chitinolyticus]
MKEIISESMQALKEATGFSGTALAGNKEEILAAFSGGYANRSEGSLNRADTRFGIASGSKLFTAAAICQLVEKGLLSFDSKLRDCLPLEFKNFDQEITIHHLLTHTSGISDYFDEETMDNFEDLWTDYPMYRVRHPQDFLPLFAEKKMKHETGRIFHYNNGGYIVLGLVIEHVSGLAFSDYVEKFIFAQANMKDSGYFEADALPERTAAGYIDRDDGSWKTNVFSLPAKGGPDGGAYVTAPDMMKFWESLMTFELLNEETTSMLLQPHVHVTNDIYYGYGLRMKLRQQDVEKYILMGYDPGVNFRSVYYPKEERSIVVCSNKSGGAFEIISAIEQEIV